MERRGARRLPAVELRPGVVCPDWSFVRSDAAREALRAMFKAGGYQRRWSRRSAAEDLVHRAVLEAYVADGRPPGRTAVARATGLDPTAVEAAFVALAQRDLVVLDGPAGKVLGAYPFTERRTGHLVVLGGRALHAMCAVDALGAGAMYRRDARIESACGACGRPIGIETRRRGTAVATAEPASAVVRIGVRYEDCAATSLCTAIAFFCGDAHLQARAAGGERAAFRAGLDEALQVGQAIFVPFLRRSP